MYNSYDIILQGSDATEENARDYAASFGFSDTEIKEQRIKYARFIDTVNGVDIYYDYGADYYFFCPA